MRRLSSLVLAVLLAACAAAPANRAAPSDEGDRIVQVRAFIAALNQRDASRLSGMVSPEIEWQSPDRRDLRIDLRGRASLMSAIRDYTADCPTCRSTITEIAVDGDQVRTVESTTWTARTGPDWQRTAGVYTFEDGRIRRIRHDPVK